MSARACKHCLWMAEGQSGLKECRKNPPILQWLLIPAQSLQGTHLQPTPAGGFPLTELNHWCGAFEEKGSGIALN